MSLRHHNRQHDISTATSTTDAPWTPLTALNNLLEQWGYRNRTAPALNSPPKKLSGAQTIRNLRAVQSAMKLFARAARQGQMDALQMMGDIRLNGLRNVSALHPLLGEIPLLRDADYKELLRGYPINHTAAFR